MAFLYPKVGYVPKVHTNVPRFVRRLSILLLSESQTRKKLNLVCTVWALDAYIHRAALWRKCNQSCMCFGSPKKGLPATKQTLSNLIVEAISLAYEASGQPSPLAIRAHSTMNMAASKALWSGVSVQDVCDAAGWPSLRTFINFYNLYLGAAPGLLVLSS